MSSDTTEESFDAIYKEQIEKEIREAVKSVGKGRIKTHAKEKQITWKNTPVKVGVTGRSGAGKSSFINAIRDVSAGDEYGAAVGVTETTMDAECYPHPDNNNLMLYDLPGAGTPQFPQKDYLTDKRVGFDNYDMFIIITSDRFSEIDLWLAEKIKKRNKILIFVRSKVYQDIRNDRQANRSRYTTNPEAATKEVVREIRQDCKNNLNEIGSETVYLIDSYAKESPFLDFGLLIDRTVQSLPQLKRDTTEESFDAIDKEQIEKEIREAFKSGGMGRIKTHAKGKLITWKNAPVKVGVTGRSGAGKSSFINAIRDVDACHEYGAAVGVCETTMNATCYPHPDNNNLMVYDLPGAGTPQFPLNDYFTDKRVGFDNYDMFIIITSDRFSEIDLWLAKEIKKRNKIFIFVRSKVYQDIRNDREANRPRYTTNPEAETKEVVQKIRQDCNNNLMDIGCETVFLIDSYDKENHFLDFGLLIDRMVKALPELKRDAFVFTLSAMTPGMIEAKKIALQRRIYRLGLLSALGGAIPIPGLSLAIDVRIVLEETIFYRKQLGLDEESLRKITELANSSMEVLGKDLKSAALEYTPKGILTFCGELDGVAKYVVYVLPILGSLIGGVMSYSTTVFTLKNILDMMVNDAKKVNDFVQIHMNASCGDEQSAV